MRQTAAVQPGHVQRHQVHVAGTTNAAATGAARHVQSERFLVAGRDRGGRHGHRGRRQRGRRFFHAALTLQRHVRVHRVGRAGRVRRFRPLLALRRAAAVQLHAGYVDVGVRGHHAVRLRVCEQTHSDVNVRRGRRVRVRVLGQRHQRPRHPVPLRLTHEVVADRHHGLRVRVRHVRVQQPHDVVVQPLAGHVPRQPFHVIGDLSVREVVQKRFARFKATFSRRQEQRRFVL